MVRSFKCGFLQKITKNPGNVLIWEFVSEEKPGMITSYTRGPGMNTVIDYDEKGFPGNYLTSYQSSVFQNLGMDFDHSSGNLLSRQDNRRQLTESFQYDNLDRLKYAGVTGGVELNMDYAPNGNILFKTGAGIYSYHPDKTNAVSGLVNIPLSTALTDQDISYTAFNKAGQIIEDGKELNIIYGPDQQRRKSVYMEGSLERTTIYGINYERVSMTGSTKHTYYLHSPTGLAAVVIKDGNENLNYTLTDHLGSITGLVDASCQNLVEEYSFDAWGRRRNPVDWSYDNVPAPTYLDRGFTGHSLPRPLGEHLDEFGLINMNGRIYDPMLGRFFSPDPYVQLPGYAGSYNRYSYCINNPLIYTDPDGEFFWIAIGIGALIGSYIGGSAAEGWQMNPTKWKWDKKTWAGIGLGAIIGAAGGAGFYYAAPAVAKTGFFTNFGASGTIAAYTLSGLAFGGAVGYSSGFVGGMIYSSGNTNYSHQSGIFGAKLGASIGAVIGTVAGLLTPESREWIAGMFSSSPSIDISLPDYDPYTLTAGSGGNSSGIKQADWSDPTDTYYGTMNSFRHIYKGNKNPAHPYGHWHVSDLYKNTPNPTGWNRFWGSMSGALSVSRTYTNGVTIRITDYQYYHVERWRDNYIGGITIPDPPPYVINAHFPSYPIRGIISVVFSNQSIFYEWLRFLQY